MKLIKKTASFIFAAFVLTAAVSAVFIGFAAVKSFSGDSFRLFGATYKIDAVKADAAAGILKDMLNYNLGFVPGFIKAAAAEAGRVISNIAKAVYNLG